MEYKKRHIISTKLEGFLQTPQDIMEEYNGYSVGWYRSYWLQNVKSITDGQQSMKSIGEIEEDLAEKAEPILGFKPSSKFKRGPIGIMIYIVCGIIAFLSLRSAGIF